MNPLNRVGLYFISTYKKYCSQSNQTKQHTYKKYYQIEKGRSLVRTLKHKKTVENHEKPPIYLNRVISRVGLSITKYSKWCC